MGLLIVCLVVILLTFAVLGTIFLAAFVKLFKQPPEIRVVFPNEFKLWLPDLVFPDRLTLGLPQTMVVQTQHLPAVEETRKPVEEPLPEEILVYIQQESDLWAQEARKRRVRMLKKETGDWDAAFRLLQAEDSI